MALGALSLALIDAFQQTIEAETCNHALGQAPAAGA